MSNQANAPVEKEDHPGKPYFELAYEQVHNHNAGITEFRAKLLALKALTQLR